MINFFGKNRNKNNAPDLVKSKLSQEKDAKKNRNDIQRNLNIDKPMEYEIVEREILPEKVICPDCGGVTLQGLEFCDKCGGELNLS